jgi:hypothetical protein
MVGTSHWALEQTHLQKNGALSNPVRMQRFYGASRIHQNLKTDDAFYSVDDS